MSDNPTRKADTCPCGACVAAPEDDNRIAKSRLKWWKYIETFQLVYARCCPSCGASRNPDGTHGPSVAELEAALEIAITDSPSITALCAFSERPSRTYERIPREVAIKATRDFCIRLSRERLAEEKTDGNR